MGRGIDIGSDIIGGVEVETGVEIAGLGGEMTSTMVNEEDTGEDLLRRHLVGSIETGRETTARRGETGIATAITGGEAAHRNRGGVMDLMTGILIDEDNDALRYFIFDRTDIMLAKFSKPPMLCAMQRKPISSVPIVARTSSQRFLRPLFAFDPFPLLSKSTRVPQPPQRLQQ